MNHFSKKKCIISSLWPQRQNRNAFFIVCKSSQENKACGVCLLKMMHKLWLFWELVTTISRLQQSALAHLNELPTASLATRTLCSDTGSLLVTSKVSSWRYTLMWLQRTTAQWVWYLSPPWKSFEVTWPSTVPCCVRLMLSHSFSAGPDFCSWLTFGDTSTYQGSSNSMRPGKKKYRMF